MEMKEGLIFKAGDVVRSRMVGREGSELKFNQTSLRTATKCWSDSSKIGTHWKRLVKEGACSPSFGVLITFPFANKTQLRN